MTKCSLRPLFSKLSPWNFLNWQQSGDRTYHLPRTRYELSSSKQFLCPSYFISCHTLNLVISFVEHYPAIPFPLFKFNNNTPKDHGYLDLIQLNQLLDHSTIILRRTMVIQIPFKLLNLSSLYFLSLFHSLLGFFHFWLFHFYVHLSSWDFLVFFFLS